MRKDTTITGGASGLNRLKYHFPTALSMKWMTSSCTFVQMIEVGSAILLETFLVSLREGSKKTEKYLSANLFLISG